jgi:hypothetical protein
MISATGPWVLPPALPDDPRRLCLVELEHVRSGSHTYYAMRYVRNNWQFQDRLKLSSEQRVARWAFIVTRPDLEITRVDG